MAVFLYQLTIVASLIVLRFFGTKAVLVGALIWSLLSMINLFFPPLIALQLAVVWITYAVLATGSRAVAPHSDQPTVKADRRPTLPPEASPRLASSPTSLAQMTEAALASISDSWGTSELSLDPAVGGPLLKQRAALDLEKAFVGFFLGRAMANREYEIFLDTADARMHELYRTEQTNRYGNLQALRTARPHFECTFGQADPPKLPDPTLQASLNSRWSQAYVNHGSYLNVVSRRLNQDEKLRVAFMDAALRKGAGPLLSRLDLLPPLHRTNDRIRSWLDSTAPAPETPRARILRTMEQHRKTSAQAAEHSNDRLQGVSSLAPPLLDPVSLSGHGPLRDLPSSSDAAAIRQIAVERQVPHLVHFTSLSNLESILRHGLQPLEEATKNGISPVVNDILRLDGRKHATSTSVAFPNASMFWKYRQESPGSKWAILLISPSVLWTHQCYFCKRNAADSRISRLTAEELMTPASFAAMFDELEAGTPRETQKLNPFDPTDPQAEVMVLGVIPPETITAVVFDDPALVDGSSSLLGGRVAVVHQNNRGFFAQRSFARSSPGSI